MDGEKERSIPRRQFVRSAVAIGGAGALSACVGREEAQLGGERTETDTSATETERMVTAPEGNPSGLPASQHEWSASLVRDAPGNTILPEHQLVLGLSYEGSTPPTDDERAAVEAAFGTLTDAFQWGTGGDNGAAFNRGLLWLVGYAPSYFEAVGDVPDALVTPETVLDAVGEDSARPDGFDAVVVMTSDFGSVVLAAEEALLGRRDSVNGVAVSGSLDGVFSLAERRTGFAGNGVPADRLDHDEIPEQAPLSMGFKSGFTDSLPSEDGVTLREGPFAGGTTLAVSRLRLELDRWYDQDHEERVKEMFCPAHDSDDVGEVGSGLGADSEIRAEDIERIESDAAEHNRVGHSQKVARARDDEFNAKILRRSEGFATDAPEHTGFNFTSIQRDFESFIEARKAMNVEEYDVDVPDENHGIVDYVNTVTRGTYLVPDREQMALPVL